MHPLVTCSEAEPIRMRDSYVSRRMFVSPEKLLASPSNHTPSKITETAPHVLSPKEFKIT